MNKRYQIVFKPQIKYNRTIINRQTGTAMCVLPDSIRRVIFDFEPEKLLTLLYLPTPFILSAEEISNSNP